MTARGNKIKTILLITLALILVISNVLEGNRYTVFADNSNNTVFREGREQTKNEQKITKKINKIAKKNIKKKDTCEVEYIEGEEKNIVYIYIKKNFYTEGNAYTIAKKIVQKVERKYSTYIDEYEFIFSSNKNEVKLSFDITRDSLNKVKIKKISKKEFKELCENPCEHEYMPGYTVVKIADSNFDGTKRRTIYISCGRSDNIVDLNRIAEEEILRYLKNNKEDLLEEIKNDEVNQLAVAIYKSVNGIENSHYVDMIENISEIDVLKDVKIFKEIDNSATNSYQNTSTDSSTTNNSITSNRGNNSISNNNSSTDSSNNAGYSTHSHNHSINESHIGKRVYVANGNRYYHSISNCKYLEGAPVSLITLECSTERFECNCWTNPVAYKPAYSSSSSSSNSASSSSSSSSSASGKRTVYIASGNSYYHNSPSCKFLKGAASSAVSINNVGGKHPCNCVKY